MIFDTLTAITFVLASVYARPFSYLQLNGQACTIIQ